MCNSIINQIIFIPKNHRSQQFVTRDKAAQKSHHSRPAVCWQSVASCHNKYVLLFSRGNSKFKFGSEPEQRKKWGFVLYFTASFFKYDRWEKHFQMFII